MLSAPTLISSVRPIDRPQNEAFSDEMGGADDGLAFFRGLANAILPSLVLWALICGAITWAFF